MKLCGGPFIFLLLNFSMEFIQTQQTQVEQSRAKQIDTGATPLPMTNAIIGLPFKNDSRDITERSGIVTRNWTYSDIVSQKQLLADLVIQTSTNGIIWGFQNSWRNVLETIFRDRLAPIFLLQSWTINFEFEFRSSCQQVGQLVVFYSNLPSNLRSYHFGLKTVNDPNPFAEYKLQTQLPHRKVPMGENVTVPVSLKWISPFKSSFGVSSYFVQGGDYANDPMYDMGTLYLAVPWPMQVATGVTPTNSVRIWVSLSDLDYGVYQPTDICI